MESIAIRSCQTSRCSLTDPIAGAAPKIGGERLLVARGKGRYLTRRNRQVEVPPNVVRRCGGTTAYRRHLGRDVGINVSREQLQVGGAKGSVGADLNVLLNVRPEVAEGRRNVADVLPAFWPRRRLHGGYGCCRGWRAIHTPRNALIDLDARIQRGGRIAAAVVATTRIDAPLAVKRPVRAANVVKPMGIIVIDWITPGISITIPAPGSLRIGAAGIWVRGIKPAVLTGIISLIRIIETSTASPFYAASPGARALHAAYVFCPKV